MSYLDTEEKRLEDQPDEAILALSVKKPELFSMLIDRYQDAFLRAAYSIVRQKEESEDIVQEAFTKIYLHANNFQKQENASFKSWAYRIVINNAISHYRKLKRRYDDQVTLDPEIYDNLPGKRDFQKDAEATILTGQLLQELPLELRKAVEMYYLEEKPYKTIAIEEQIPLSTLKMRLFRAKKLLKTYIN